MKSFTDLEQSKKLAEILPLESADMYYPNRIDIKYQGALSIEYKHGNPLLSQEIAAWSLAVLLNVLPTYLFEFDRGIDLNVYPNLNGRGWHCSYMPNCIENMKTDKFKLITSGDTLVDACVTMIEKLHEQKLL